MSPYIVALTGASGAVYGIRLVKALAGLGHEIALVISDSARAVVRAESGYDVPDCPDLNDFSRLFEIQNPEVISFYSCDDLTAPIASGSYPVKGMIIAPCSMATLGAIACGAGRNLIHRAADCALKEGRKLILVPRETPLSAVHLENLLKLSRMGASVVPAMPAFYSGADGVEDLIGFMTGKVLDQLGIEHFSYPRWTGCAERRGPLC
jgi:4-hydroxy-3-polyprenylbenzoate decarboxylase